MDNKQEVLSDLYTLRAGLSWISQQKQEINRLQNSVKVPARVTEEQVLAQSKKRVEDLEAQLETEQKEVSEAKAIKKQFEWSFSEGYMWLTWILHIVFLGAGLGLFYWGYTEMDEFFDSTYLVFGSLALIGSIVCWIFSICFFDGSMRWPASFVSLFWFVAACACVVGFFVLSSQDNTFWKWAVLAMSGLSVVEGITYLCVARNLFKEENRRISNVKTAEDRVEHVQNELINAEQNVEKARTVDWPKAKQQNEAEIAEAYRQIDEIKKTQIEPLAELCNNFYETLSATFNSKLDVRDWQYVDLVIYYVETNRAETIRESLQQVDRERQTQQIVSSMRMATQQICRSIRTEMRSLGQSIGVGFDRLEGGISSLQQNMSAKLASLKSSVDSSAAQTRLLASAQITQTSLTNALLEKSNETSEQLMNDVHYLRERLY